MVRQGLRFTPMQPGDDNAASTTDCQSAVEAPRSADERARLAPPVVFVPWLWGNKATRIVCITIGGIAAYIGIVLAVSGVLSIRGMLYVMVMFTFAIVAVLLILAIHGRRRADRLIARHIAEASDTRALAMRLIDHVTGFAPQLALKRLAAALAKHSRTGQAIVYYHKQCPVAPDPLMQVFEPRLIDESDEAFDELDRAQSGSGGAQETTPGASDAALARRRFSRNIRLMGGGLVFAVFALNLLSNVVSAVEAGRLTLELYFWVGLTLLLLLLIPQAHMLESRQWLLVPGGLMLRSAGWRDRAVRLHVFDRRTSALVAAEMWKDVWCVAVADGRANEVTSMTSREFELFLRAWQSSLEPPPLTRLSDFR